MPRIEMIHADCMEFMAGYQDKQFNLAIVDPPYGIGENWKKDPNSNFYHHKSTYKNTDIPNIDYFEQLFRISINRIIWGANYYTDYLPASNGWIVWDKKRSFIDSHMSEAELAWHSFNIPVRIAEFIWNGCITIEKRFGIHPHEKPVALYKWLLQNYAKPGQTIFDSHGGSGSICIACYDLGFDLTWIEKDEDYYKAAVKRFEEHKAKYAPASEIPITKYGQAKLF